MVDEASYAKRPQRSSGLLAPSPPRTPKPASVPRSVFMYSIGNSPAEDQKAVRWIRPLGCTRERRDAWDARKHTSLVRYRSRNLRPAGWERSPWL